MCLTLSGAIGTMLISFFSGIGAEPVVALIFSFMIMSSLYVLRFLHTILHEGGHLVCGLASGYRFCSFRIGSFMFVKREGRIVCKRLSIMGTGGQCLLSPPEPYRKDIPFLMYNLGGSLSNFLFSGVALAVILLWGDSLHPFTSLLLKFFILLGLSTGVTNIVPWRTPGISNDGRNVQLIKKDPLSHYMFWLQLHINTKIDGGARLKDLPDELFISPEPLNLKLIPHSALAVYRCKRTLDKGDYPVAMAEIDALLAKAPNLFTAHRCLLVSERIFCGYLLGENSDSFARFYTKEFNLFLKSSRKRFHAQRLLYTEARLGKPDETTAQAALAQFEKAAKHHPHSCEIEAEREHMAAVDAALAKREGAAQEN